MLSVEEISKLILNDSNSDKKKFARIGQNYYEANHDILNTRLFYYNADGNLVEDKARSNIKICHPFFTELCDQLASYMLSFKDNPVRATETAEGLQEQLDSYFDEEFWAEISELVTGADMKGFEYLYAYKNADNRLSFQCADSLGVVEVKANDTDDNCEYVIYWYIETLSKNQKSIKRIQVWDKEQVYYYVQEINAGSGGAIMEDKSISPNPSPHVIYIDDKGKKLGAGLGYIPFWRLDNNRKQISSLKPIKALIDDYDLMQCGLSNNLTDFDTPLHIVTGYEGDNLDELQANLKTKKIIGVDEGGGVEVRTVDIPYQARKTKADEDEKNIYRFGMGFNSSQVGDGNITNVVIRSRYTLLELKANKLEKRLKKLLKDIIKIVLEEINALNGTDYQYKDVYFDFVREIMTNEQENAQNEKTRAETKQIEVNTMLNLAATLDDETIIRNICDILEIDYEEVKGRLPSEEDLKTVEEEIENIEPVTEPLI